MTPSVPELEADDAHDAAAGGALLLDVREPEEWHAGHAPDAVHIPMREVLERSGELPRDRRIVAVCRSGRRSQSVVEALVAAGFDAANAVGGMQAWQAQGFEVVTDAGVPGVVA